jgi:hypothetical protein
MNTPGNSNGAQHSGRRQRPRETAMLSGRADWKFHPKNIGSKGDDFIYGKKPT